MRVQPPSLSLQCNLKIIYLVNVISGSLFLVYVMKLLVVCLLAVLGTALSAPTVAQTDFFENLLGIIKVFLCQSADQGEGDSEDLFQMIINLAKIFLCDDSKDTK